METAKKEGNHLDYIKFKNYSQNIKEEHIYLLMKYLKSKNIEFIVAPYEADAQLAYMQKLGQIDYVITEDSDLILYNCSDIISKLNQSGYCELLQLNNNNLLGKNSDTEEVEEFMELTHDQKIWMSIMVGCDYLDKVKGVGLKKGIEIIKQCNTLKELFKVLKERCKRFDDSEEYKQSFFYCEYVFKYQMVYNSKLNKLCYFQDPDKNTLKMFKQHPRINDFLGTPFNNIQDHITGKTFANQFKNKDPFPDFDFKELERKILHSTYAYSMNPISNLISQGQKQWTGFQEGNQVASIINFDQSKEEGSEDEDDHELEKNPRANSKYRKSHSVSNAKENGKVLINDFFAKPNEKSQISTKMTVSKLKQNTKDKSKRIFSTDMRSSKRKPRIVKQEGKIPLKDLMSAFNEWENNNQDENRENISRLGRPFLYLEKKNVVYFNEESENSFEIKNPRKIKELYNKHKNDKNQISKSKRKSKINHFSQMLNNELTKLELYQNEVDLSSSSCLKNISDSESEYKPSTPLIGKRQNSIALKKEISFSKRGSFRSKKINRLK